MKGQFESELYSKVQTGELAGSATAVNMPNIPCKLVMFVAMSDNATNVFIGGSAAVTVAAGTTTTTAGYMLDAGDTTPWLPIPNLNLLWYIGGASDDLLYIALS